MFSGCLSICACGCMYVQYICVCLGLPLNFSLFLVEYHSNLGLLQVFLMS